MGRWRIIAAGALTILLAGSTGMAATARACSVDGVPSLTVNGYSVVINTAAPKGAADLRVWAPFVLGFPLHTGRDELMTEIRTLVALQPEAFTTPWRWSFGDGTPAVRAASVHHTFRRPGTYKITVDAYFPSAKLWYTFDAVQVRVVRG